MIDPRKISNFSEAQNSNFYYLDSGNAMFGSTRYQTTVPDDYERRTVDVAPGCPIPFMAVNVARQIAIILIDMDQLNNNDPFMYYDLKEKFFSVFNSLAPPPAPVVPLIQFSGNGFPRLSRINIDEAKATLKENILQPRYDHIQQKVNAFMSLHEPLLDNLMTPECAAQYNVRTTSSRDRTDIFFSFKQKEFLDYRRRTRKLRSNHEEVIFNIRLTFHPSFNTADQLRTNGISISGYSNNYVRVDGFKVSHPVMTPDCDQDGYSAICTGSALGHIQTALNNFDFVSVIELIKNSFAEVAEAVHTNISYFEEV
jgi:hypothetical protein